MYISCLLVMYIIFCTIMIWCVLLQTLDCDCCADFVGIVVCIIVCCCPSAATSSDYPVSSFVVVIV